MRLSIKLILMSIVGVSVSLYCMAKGPICQQCTIKLEKGSLVVENSRIKRVYLWNEGNLITKTIENKVNSYVWNSTDHAPDMSLPGIFGQAHLLYFNVDTIQESDSHYFCLTANIVYSIGELQIKRVIRLFPDCPAIASDFYFKGKIQENWYLPQVVNDSLKDIRFVRLGKARKYVPIIEKTTFPGKHWRYNVVELFEMTDDLNNLVREYRPLGFFERLYRGNLLFAQNEEKQGLFFLKEAPSPNAQLRYYGGDYLTTFGQIRMIGFGIDKEDLSTDAWTQGYSSVVGVYADTEYNALESLRKYQNKLRKKNIHRDEMIMMNTWGDWQDATNNINEKYILEELDLCSKLGLSHYQLDYGWQTSLKNLPSFDNKTQNYRDDDNYWLPDKYRFPNGFTPIMEKAKQLGIEIGVWFEPNYNDNYAHWKQDAKWLIRLNKQYGIHVFKVDGLRIHNKKSEERVDSLLMTLSKALNDSICINLDVTADKRFGYFFKNRYGNFFLENRYTDWGGYYPYQTLRNLWMISKYVPTQNIQLEFLNKWRYIDKYNDIYAPANYNFEYLFAITMMAQPLAWMQAHNLPPQGFDISPVIKRYREWQNNIHQGLILPIGNEPSGCSWTGFQSILEQKGFLLIFRENNLKKTALIKTWLAPHEKVRIHHILGEGKDFLTETNENGEILFSLSKKNSYSLYQYEILK